MLKTRKYERYSIDSESGKVLPDAAGNLFIENHFQWNSDELKVLHMGVDTVKQLYGGVPDKARFDEIQAIYDQGYGGTIELMTSDGVFNTFLVGSGGKGGYRFSIQNAEIGVVILFSSIYVPKIDEDKPESPHNVSNLKIELSPHLILAKTPDDIQQFTDVLAKQFMTQIKPSGIAVHLCADIQGVEIPDDFDLQLTTRTRRIVSRTGLSEINFPLMASKYGAGQSFLFGRADSVQFALYRKDIQAKENDKMHLWGAVWSEALDRHLEPAYDREAPVWRIELRFHHTAIDELARDKDLEIKTFEGVSKLLLSFWQYGLDKCYRWDHNHLFIHPAWQYLIELNTVFTNNGLVFSRRVKKQPGEGNQKNVALAIGNMLSIYARNKFPIRYAMTSLKKSGIWRDILGYYALKTGIYDNEGDLVHMIREDIEAKLTRKRIGRGLAA
ncbi:hypothetical protein [Methylomonas sp. UP202]|uniref:hypothetical protein n=1 Tax=Methylomonas sp. UP202 TaxID=3040943 RepID=UPI00247A3E9A|nr:hypothetical protein [Methylomonas sp. UP202]WGS84969.1 hypothetical protein QC632_18220 [Methylomonas sp. UP202]